MEVAELPEVTVDGFHLSRSVEGCQLHIRASLGEQDTAAFGPPHIRLDPTQVEVSHTESQAWLSTPIQEEPSLQGCQPPVLHRNVARKVGAPEQRLCEESLWILPD